MVGWSFVVDLAADSLEGGAGVLFRFEGETHPDYLEGVGEEDGGHAGGGAGEEPADGGFLGGGGDEDRADLLVGEEFDGCVGEYTEEGCRVASEETADAVLTVDVSHGCYHTEPGTGVFGELRIGGLEEDLDTVEGTDYCFGLEFHSVVSFDAC